MALGEKRIIKILKQALGTDAPKAFLMAKSEKYKGGILALTPSDDIALVRKPFFGAAKLLHKVNAKDVSYADFVYDVGVNKTAYIFLTYGNEKDVLKIPTHLLNDDPSVYAIVKAVYDANPDAKPQYYEGKELIDFFPTKDGLMKIFDDKILIQKKVGNEIQTVETIPTGNIQSFDYYKEEIATKMTLMLNINGQKRKFKVMKQNSKRSFTDLYMQGGDRVLFTDYPLVNIMETFKKTQAQKAVPDFLQEDEIPYVDEKVTTSRMGTQAFTKKFFILTNKRILIVEKNKDGFREPKEQANLSDVQSVKHVMISQGGGSIGERLGQMAMNELIEKASKNKNLGKKGYKHGFVFTLKNGKKISVYDVDYFDIVEKKLQELGLPLETRRSIF